MNSKYEYKNCSDHGPEPYILNVGQQACANKNFRTAIWTGEYLQMTLMRIPVGGEIGLEVHPDTDQFLRIEQGHAKVCMGECKCNLSIQQTVCSGDAVFVPAGTWHNMINIGNTPLSVSSIYAPPNHPHGTIHETACDAKHEEH